MVILNSGGGLIDVADIILEILAGANVGVTLMALGSIYSAAFELFFRADCDKIIHPHTLGMFHFGFDDISMDENGKAKGEEAAARMNLLKLMKPKTLELCELLGMTTGEIRKIKSGKDVYFQPNRLHEFLKSFNEKRAKIVS